MKRNLLILIVFFLSVIIEISFFSNFFSAGRTPSLIFLEVVLWSSQFGFKTFWKWAFVAGIILDILSFNIIGLETFSLVLISFIASLFSRRWFTSEGSWPFLVFLALIFFGTFMNDFLSLAFVKIRGSLLGTNHTIFYLWSKDIVWNAFYNLFLALVSYRWVRTLGNYLFRKNQFIVRTR